MRDFVVRRASTEGEITAAGELTVEAYHADGVIDPEGEYDAELRDAARRVREATLLVAVVPVGSDGTDGATGARGSDDVVVGTVTIARPGTFFAEIAQPGELEIRMLAVAPSARRHGVAEALVRAAQRETVAAGACRLVLSTLDSMTSAHRLYARLGFGGVPERAWYHDGVDLRCQAWCPPGAPGAAVEAATWRPVEAVAIGRNESTPGGGAWRLGLSGGFTSRANSVVALAEPTDVDAAIAEVERCYAAAGLPPRFRICAATRPVGLGALLAARGYRAVVTTHVLVRDDLEKTAPAPDRLDGIRTGIADLPDDEWLAGWLDVKARSPVDPTLAQAILTGSPARYLTARDDAGVVAVIRAARLEDWVALSCLMTAPRARRRGIGRALTLAALRDAVARGAKRAFLQVEDSNVGALTLYSGLGFVPAECYRYLER